MITDYIGGEGSAETPKNDYVIYGWPLREKETLWMGRGADWGVSWTTQLTSFNFVIGHCEDHSVSAEITKQHKIILHVSIYALWEFIHKHRKSAKLLWHHVRLKI